MKNCPRCKEGKLVEGMAIIESEIDFSESLRMGIMLGMGFFPTYRKVEHVEYTCSKHCGYSVKEKR